MGLANGAMPSRNFQRNEQIGLFGGCSQCGHTEERAPAITLDGKPLITSKPVTWRCVICERLVCRDCVVCLADRTLGMREIFHVTYCSPRCRQLNRIAYKLGFPLYSDDQIDELADYERQTL